MGQGSSEHDLLGELDNNFSNFLLCYSRKTGEHGGGESGVMCCKLTEAENVERIFSIFSVKNSMNLSAKS